MAKAKKVATTVVKWKKKKWYSLVAPGFLNKQPLGDTLADEDSKVDGRIVSVNLMTLTKDIKKQNVNVGFKVDKIQGDTAFTSIVKYEILPSSVRRMVRKNTKKVDPSFACYTGDNKRVRVKMIVLTRSLTKSSVLQSLRKSLIQAATVAIKKLTSDQLFIEIINSRFQRKLSSELRKIYPLRFCEVKFIEIEPLQKKAKAIEVTDEQLAEAKEKEEKARAKKAKEVEAKKAKEEPKEEVKPEAAEVKEVKKDEPSSD